MQVVAGNKKLQKQSVYDPHAAHVANELLLKACDSENFEGVKKALAEGADPNVVDAETLSQ